MQRSLISIDTDLRQIVKWRADHLEDTGAYDAFCERIDRLLDERIERRQELMERVASKGR